MEGFSVFRRHGRLGRPAFPNTRSDALFVGQILSFGFLFASCVMAAIRPDNALTAAHAVFLLSLIGFHRSHSNAFFTFGFFLTPFYCVAAALFVVNPGNILSLRGASLLPLAMCLVAVATTYSHYVGQRRARFLAYIGDQVRLAHGPPSRASSGLETEASSCSSISLSSHPVAGYIREVYACFSWRDDDFEDIGYLAEEGWPDILQGTLGRFPVPLSGPTLLSGSATPDSRTVSWPSQGSPQSFPEDRGPLMGR